MIVMDINGLPDLHLEDGRTCIVDILNIAREGGVLLYDSTKGDQPVLYDEDDIVIYDIHSKEGIKYLKDHELDKK